MKPRSLPRSLNTLLWYDLVPSLKGEAPLEHTTPFSLLFPYGIIKIVLYALPIFFLMLGVIKYEKGFHSSLLTSCPRWCVPLLVRIGSIPIKGKTVNDTTFYHVT